jgi:2-succinyl-5-enolpyruvyl-6-hydroxy-3-cyclohexene-1-carboxylate synthase
MNPSTALATVVVDELARGGVREAVLSPGSRNAPLAFALHEADRLGRLRLHVRIDERSAGFLALGLAKASGRPVPVVTTSGTAAVNLHPAVVEAAYAAVPLIAVTADRPPEMHGIGANQTIDQDHLFGSTGGYVSLGADPGETPQGWRRLVADALEQARRGAVQLNVAFRDPLVPDGDGPSVGRTDQPLMTRGKTHGLPFDSGAAVSDLAADRRTVVVAGDRAFADVRTLAAAGGWPLFAEPSSGHRAGPNALATYRLLLDHLGAEIERVVVAGRPTLSRPVTRLLARDGLEVVRLRDDDPRTPAVVGEPDAGWLQRWQEADRAASEAVTDVLAAEAMSGLAVARTVAGSVPAGGLLVAGSSSAVRDLDLADPWPVAPLVLANRGASGIDGTVSTAVGAALAHPRGPAYALMGDLTFLHDSTGLVIGPGEPRPDLTVVVVNDDGGGLFGLLEQGAPEHGAVFERVFGTPHGVDLEAQCAATSTPHLRVGSLDHLAAELRREPPGIRVLEVRTDRSRIRDLHAMLRSAVAAALA